MGRVACVLWTTVTGAAIAAVVGCASPARGQHRITVVFPTAALQEATSQVELQLYRQASGTDHCTRLTRQEPVTEEPLVDAGKQAVTFPAARGGLVLQSLPDATYAIVVTAWNMASMRARCVAGSTSP